MSQSFKLAKAKLSHVIKSNKPNQSTSSFSSGLVVGDSHLTKKSMVTNVATGALFGLIGLVMFSIVAVFGGDDVSATASSITITPSAVSTYANIPPTAEGKFAATGTVTYGITTTHASGYTASVSATDLSYVDNSVSPSVTYTISSLASGTAITAEQFAASEGTAYTNKWGYLPATYYDESGAEPVKVTNNDKYFPAPIGTTQKLDETSIANPSTPNNYDITVGARVDHTIEQGQYATTITVSAVGNPTPYSITYNANAGSSGDTVDNMPTNHTALDDGATGDTINLASNYPYRNNYLFIGWCTGQVADNGACNSPNIQYNPGATFELDQTSTIGEGDNSLVLYAMWDNCSGPNSSQLLYCKVRAQVKKDGSGNERTQTLADMQAVITEPTSSNPLTDTSNSGVYKYDSRSVAEGGFGPASDAANSMPIYYFRGILDSAFASSDSYGNIGSSGSSGYYQNYVKLANDTCWRIVRTTGSGGVKIIYNGIYGATTSESCVNSSYRALVANVAFNLQGTSEHSDEDKWNNNINYVGYTFNNDVTDSTVDTSVDTVFGSNANYSVNSTNSNIKDYIENTWYTGTMKRHIDGVTVMYDNILENSAGYCNDRSLYSTTSGGAILDHIVPYIDSGSWVYFGSYIRNTSPDAGKAPSLTCPRSVVDVYSFGATNSSGNEQLSKPVSLLTADEASLAGSGHYATSQAGMSGSLYNPNSYLRTATHFWLNAPSCRDGWSGYAKLMMLSADGHIDAANRPINVWGVRPVVSLTSRIIVTSGSGTATDPWTIAE